MQITSLREGHILFCRAKHYVSDKSSLKLQRRHFDKVVINIEITELFSEETVKRMEHGTVSERHALATLASGETNIRGFPSNSTICAPSSVYVKLDSTAVILWTPMLLKHVFLKLC
jgi:hypothetical protein